jgi:SAM-dependent methyltransferase
MAGAEAPDFDRVARIYRWAEYLALGRLLEQTRFHWIPRLAGRRRALVLGDGDGRFVARVLAQHPGLQALAVDTSGAMLELLRQRCAAHAGRLQTLQGDALGLLLQPKLATAIDVGEVDLIVTHFFLDCLTQEEVEALAMRLSAQVGSGTVWLVSDFALPRWRVLRPLAAVYLRLLYLAFRVLTGLRVTRLPDVQRALALAGFERVARRERVGGFVYTEIWVREQGVGSRE